MEYNFSRYNIVSEKKGIPYIVNTLSGALIKLDVPTYSILKEKNIFKVLKKHIPFLKDKEVA